MSRFDAIIIGASAGGLEALQRVFSPLPAAYPLRLAVVRHLHPDSTNGMAGELAEMSVLPTREMTDKMPFEPGIIHCAPANYHVALESDLTFALLIEPRINYARPSIDLFFQTAAEVFRDKLMAIILSGAGTDGCQGLARVGELGGQIIVQDPSDAIMPALPAQAIRLLNPKHILNADQIGELIAELG